MIRSCPWSTSWSRSSWALSIPLVRFSFSFRLALPINYIKQQQIWRTWFLQRRWHIFEQRIWEDKKTLELLSPILSEKEEFWEKRKRDCSWGSLKTNNFLADAEEALCQRPENLQTFYNEGSYGLRIWKQWFWRNACKSNKSFKILITYFLESGLHFGTVFFFLVLEGFVFLGFIKNSCFRWRLIKHEYETQ